MSKTEDVARRAVACKGFRWMRGVRDIETATVLAVRDGEVKWWEPGWREPIWVSVDEQRPGQWLPDMDDPATLGCFEHGMLPACGYHDAHLDAYAGPEGRVVYGIVYRPDPISFPSKWFSACEDGSPTKAEALVAALEAAPETFS